MWKEERDWGKKRSVYFGGHVGQLVLEGKEPLVLTSSWQLISMKHASQKLQRAEIVWQLTQNQSLG